MKKILAILMAAILAVAVIGCQASEPGTTDDPPITEPSAEPKPDVTEDKIELVVWESVDGPDQWIIEAGKKFTETYPNITIKFVNVELGDSSSQIMLDGPAGIGPDLFAAPHDRLGELVVGGHIMPTVDADKVAGDVLGACSSALTYDGTMYGYPTSAETYALFYNKALISDNEVPKTWDDLVAWVQAFNAENSDKHGFIMDVSNIYYSILFTTKNGNRLFGPSGTDTSSSYLNTADAVAGMEQFQALRSILPFPAADLPTSMTDGAFAAGNAAMYITGPWNVANFRGSGIDFGVATIPALAGESTPAATFSGTRGMFVSAYSKYPQEAALFASYLISNEAQMLRYQITGALPSVDIPVDDEASLGFIAQLDYAFPMPSVPQMSAFWESGNAASSNIWDGADVQAELNMFEQAIMAYVG